MGRHARIRLSFLFLSLVLLPLLINNVSSQEQPASQYFYLPWICRSVPSVRNIAEPLIIDGENGRIYAIAEVNGVRQTVVLSTADGRYLYSYPYAGRLALDRHHDKLLIDQGGEGIVLLDSTNGIWLADIDLPHDGDAWADPQVDPNQGIAYAFRENSVYLIDVQKKEIAGSKTLFVQKLVCGEPQGAATIDRSFYDPISNTLYLSFFTHWCTPHAMDTIHIYDAASWTKWGEYQTPSLYQAVAFAANLYGVSYDRGVGTYAYWARSRTETWYGEFGGSNWPTLAGNVVDWSRGLLYEAIWDTGDGEEVEKQIRISATENRQTLATVDYDRPPIQKARLVGHDPHTDQLYFLDQDKIHVVPTSSILPVD